MNRSSNCVKRAHLSLESLEDRLVTSANPALIVPLAAPVHPASQALTTPLAAAVQSASPTLEALKSAASPAGAPAQFQAAKKEVLAGQIKNNLPFTVYFQARIDKGAWITYKINPGKTLCFSFPYPAGSNRRISVRWDNTLGDGKVTNSETPLAMWVCSKPENGWMHTFDYYNDHKHIRLFRA